MHVPQVFPPIDNILREYLVWWVWLRSFHVMWDLRVIVWSMKATVIWIVTPCSLIGMHQCVGMKYYIHCHDKYIFTGCMASHPATVIFNCMLIHLPLYLTLLPKMLITLNMQCTFKLPGSLKVTSQEHAK